jgi:uncharacterized membrane protein YhaH (DUF805 family)
VNARHKPYLLFLLLLALFPALAVAVRAVQEGTASLAAWEWLLLAAFPLILLEGFWPVPMIMAGLILMSASLS